MTEAAPPELAAVIINHDDSDAVVAQWNAYCRHHAEGFRRIQWLVIHNGAEALPKLTGTDGQTDGMLESVPVIESENLGYAAAIQLAMRRTQAPFLLVLNADLLPESGCLSAVLELVEELVSRPRKIGVVGFRLLNADGTLQGSAGKFPTLWRTLFGLLRPRASRKYLNFPLEGQTEAPWVTGASFLLSRACLEEIGGLDERFFMYYEDVDLCLRAKQAGWTTLYDPAACWRHFHPYHGRALTHRMVYFARHGLLRYFWKHRSAWEFRVLTWIVLRECWLRKRRDAIGNGWNIIESMVRDHWERPAEFQVKATDLP